MEHPREVRIGHVVEDDETRINRLFAIFASGDRPGVPAQARFSLKKRHLMRRGQEICRREAGNASPHDSDILTLLFLAYLQPVTLRTRSWIKINDPHR